MNHISREERHVRRIDMHGYRRSDGLFEVTGQVTDNKAPGFVAPAGVRHEPGRPFHDMGVRLVFDAGMTVRAVDTFTAAAPFAPCPGGGASLQALIGLRIGKGWQAEVRKTLPNAETCTHLRELLVPMATTAIQMMVEFRRDVPEPVDADGRPLRIDSCHAYAAHRELVLHRWPRFHRPAAGGEGPR